MSKYAKLDNFILSKIGDRPMMFSAIFTNDVQQECRAIAEAEGKHVFDSFRILDRRIQALRKLGVIRNVTGKGWVKS